MKTSPKLSPKCPIRTTLEMLGGKWRLLIIHQVGMGANRFGELKRQIPDISEKMLAQELRFLVDSDLLHRQNFGEVPPRVEYTLTAKGKLAQALIEPISKFGISYLQA